MKKYNFITREFLIREYSKKEKSMLIIAKEIECSEGTIKNRLIKYKIKIRTWSEARKNKFKGEKNGRHIDGRCSKKYYCMECGKEISISSGIYGQGRCESCAYKGKLHSQYIDGRTLKKYYCPDCGIEISYRAKRCQSCAAKHNWQIQNHRNKIIKASRKGNLIKPTRPEKQLNEILQNVLPNEYNFVGDGEAILGGFNPDFINCNRQKKIIELYGCYWHKCQECGFGKGREIDKLRLIAYRRYGYKTLIIWEHELKDLEKLISRIMEFEQ